MKKATQAAPRIIRAASLSAREPLEQPIAAPEESLLLFFTPRSEDAAAFDAAQRLQHLYHRAMTADRHYILAAPAPAPSVGMPWGAARLLETEPLLRAWLQAALRASAEARVSLLWPAAGSPAAQSALRKITEQVMTELYRKGEPFDELLAVGTTLGTPASLLSAGSFCEEADFAVIDTDSLLRLSLAAAPDTPFFEEALQASATGLLRLLEIGVGNLRMRRRFVAVGGRLAHDERFAEHLQAIGADALILPPLPRAALRRPRAMHARP